MGGGGFKIILVLLYKLGEILKILRKGMWKKKKTLMELFTRLFCFQLDTPATPDISSDGRGGGDARDSEEELGSAASFLIRSEISTHYIA